jgi:transcriptional regulator with XRE-family HTH domain
VATRGDPAPLRWLIGVELARYRNQTGLSMAEAADRSGLSKSKIGNLESAWQQQAPDDIAQLLETYGVSQRDIDRMTSLAGRSDDATWWAPWAQVVPDWFKTFVGLEGLAEHEFVFEPIVIPGLLQTEDYAYAVTTGTPRVRPDHGERVVGFRMARSQRLRDPERPLSLHTVITDGALRLRIGSKELRRAQLKHLVTMSELPSVTIQVVRPEDGLHSATLGHFAVLDFPDVRSIGYTELHDGAVYVQDPDQVRTYTKTAENVQRVALGPAESVEYIKTLISP